VAVTVKETVQLLLAVTVRPLTVKTPLPFTAVTGAPVQVVAGAGGLTMVIFPGAPPAAVGSVSVKPTAVMSTGLELVRVKVKIDCPPPAMEAGENDFTAETGARTVTSSAVELSGL